MKKDKLIFVLHKKNQADKSTDYPYSLVTPEVFKTIPKSAVYKIMEVESKSYSKEELEALRREMV